MFGTEPSVQRSDAQYLQSLRIKCRLQTHSNRINSHLCNAITRSVVRVDVVVSFSLLTMNRNLMELTPFVVVVIQQFVRAWKNAFECEFPLFRFTRDEKKEVGRKISKISVQVDLVSQQNKRCSGQFTQL